MPSDSASMAAFAGQLKANLGLRLVVFTDLDGTLLDHDTYSHEAAAPALETLRALGVPVVLASSKTAAEMWPLHRELQLEGSPIIVENGAGVLFEPGQGPGNGGDHARIRAALARIDPALSSLFTGFADMDAGAVAAATGLDLEASALARQRAFSEPGLWRGGDDDRARFVSALAELGVAARAGGRFLTLSLGRTKADGMREVARRLKPDVTIALGDAPNDIEMLRQADYGVIVRNDHAPAIPPLAGEKSGRILRTRLAGPRGWNAAIARLLRELGIQ